MASVRPEPQAKTRWRARLRPKPATLIAPAVLMAALLLSGCDYHAQSAEARPPMKAPGNVARGGELLNRYGCGGCHEIPGIVDAKGLVGPPLVKMGRRTIIAGVLHNSPETMHAWIMDPQRFVPGNAMPDLNVSPRDAEDMTAYLYTLR